jgi:hypothetical protein
VWTETTASLRNSSEVHRWSCRWLREIERDWERLRWSGRSRTTRQFFQGFYSSRHAPHSEFIAGQRSGSGGDIVAWFGRESLWELASRRGRGWDRHRRGQQGWRWSTTAAGQHGLIVGVSTPRERGRRRRSSPQWVPPGSQIPNRYPGRAPDGLACWAGLMGFGQVRLFSIFLFDSFSSMFCFGFLVLIPICFAGISSLWLLSKYNYVSTDPISWHYICIRMKGELLFIIVASIGFPSRVCTPMNMMLLIWY